MTYLVHDYDEAIDFFTRALRFTLIEDIPMGPDNRWDLLQPAPAHGACQESR